ncbi:alpha-beta hydrolase superfamily lysophospholipase [Stella humosa]|uniref:Alpha-beta hydrolase superfamily lysophospholipase n=1 Tax=Stella humosa TaxID=94 RepID=A0A3N1KTG4_9PROT|nr:alpha/beta hydrolase [Stella humosa]ROP81396.1 alpha-beta hydrolase superfamily lysophospholipase [Stella humosa]BBK32747.1 alpha/beta hydrolase [Stella humosa]
MPPEPPRPQTRVVPVYCSDALHPVHCAVWGAANTGPTAIILHGFLQNGRECDHLAAALAAAGWRVFCPDFPGHGRSAWLRDGEYRFTTYAATIATMLAVADRPDIHLVARSMGGVVAMRMAGQAGIPLGSLTLVDVAVQWPPDAVAYHSSLLPKEMEFANPMAAAEAVRLLVSDRGPISFKGMREVLEYSMTRTRDGRIRFRCDPRLRTSIRFLDMQRGDKDRSDSWRAIEVPTLLVRGGRSIMLTADTADRMIAMNPRAELLTLADAGHPPWLRRPAEVAPIVAWLGRQALAARQRLRAGGV